MMVCCTPARAGKGRGSSNLVDTRVRLMSSSRIKRADSRQQPKLSQKPDSPCKPLQTSPCNRFKEVILHTHVLTWGCAQLSVRFTFGAFAASLDHSNFHTAPSWTAASAQQWSSSLPGDGPPSLKDAVMSLKMRIFDQHALFTLHGTVFRSLCCRR